MSKRRANSRRVKRNRTYTVSELAKLLDIHKNTIRNWQRDGLEPIDGSRPVLFHGEAVGLYLMLKRTSREQTCPPGTLYCFSCREPKKPALGMVDYIDRKAGAGNLRALCCTCETVMHRRASRAALSSVMPGISVQIVEASSRLTETVSPSVNCDLEGGIHR